MAKFSITGTRSKQSIEATWYRQEGDFFVFYRREGTQRLDVVATVAANGVHSIITEADDAKD